MTQLVEKITFAGFLAVFSVMYFCLHYYVYLQTVTGLALAGAPVKTLRIFFITGSLTFFIGEFLNRQLSVPSLRFITYIGAFWFGVISIAVSVFVVRHIFMVFFHSASFRFYSAIVSFAVILLISLYSAYNGSRKPVVREVEVPCSKLPEDVKEFSIVHLSDVHLNFSKPPSWLDYVVEETNRLDPDMVVITGDLVDVDLNKSDEFAGILKKLKPGYGVFAIAGNHEFYAGIEVFQEFADKAGITVLRNSCAGGTGPVALAGIDDISGKHFVGKGPEPEQALEGCDFTKPVILLSHQPEIFRRTSKLGIDLQLSGHTHAGQIPPLDIIGFLYFRYSYGLYREGRAHIYTSCGTGTWGPPMRLFSRSEIARITLRNAS